MRKAEPNAVPIPTLHLHSTYYLSSSSEELDDTVVEIVVDEADTLAGLPELGAIKCIPVV